MNCILFCFSILMWCSRCIYSKNTLIPSCLHAFSKGMFSPTLLQQMHLTLQIYFEFISFIGSIIWFFKSLFSLKKYLQQLFVQSLVTHSQCCLLPLLFVECGLWTDFNKQLLPPFVDVIIAFLLTLSFLTFAKAHSPLFRGLPFNETSTDILLHE